MSLRFCVGLFAGCSFHSVGTVYFLFAFGDVELVFAFMLLGAGEFHFVFLGLKVRKAHSSGQSISVAPS
ncbi:MAG: hypothetical protein ACI3Z9_08960 [Candidatus Onthomorpha sp.]